MARIGFIVPYMGMYDEAKKIIKGQSDVDLRIGLMKGAKDVALDLINNGAEVLISRGGTTGHLREDFPYMPICDIEIGSYDVARAIQEAKTSSKQIALITYDDMHVEEVDLSELFDCEIKAFRIKRGCNINEILNKAFNEGFSTVVGGKTVEKVANQLGLRSVLIESGASSIRNAIKQARQILSSKDEAMKNVQLINDVIENTTIGIIAINKDNVIKIANKQAKELLFKNAKSIVGKTITPVVPIDKIEENKNIIIEVNGDNILINKKTQALDSMDVSAIITVEKSSDIYEKERDIRSTYVKRGYKANYSFEDIHGNSEAIKETIEISRKYATVDSTILIQGETGTGKELFAQSIHRCSRRKHQAFVAVNCAALTESLLESELFGYEKGAFTGALTRGKPGLFEMADGGTIFLDEISEISPKVQAKLLRVIQEREVMRIGGDQIIPIDVRIIAATNKNLLDMIEETNFRSDLYYRISVLRIQLPLLIERGDDLKVLFNEFLDNFCFILSREKPVIDVACYDVLFKYNWPGNIRELRNLVERLVIVHEGKVVLPDMIYKLIDMDIKPVIQELNQELIMTVLENNNYNKTKTAKELGISRTTLWKLLKDDNE